MIMLQLLGPIPDVVAGAGAMAVFAFALLGMMWSILKGYQKYIFNHMSEATKALISVVKSNEALEKAVKDERQKDASFDEKTKFWNELNAQNLSAADIAARMKEKFGE